MSEASHAIKDIVLHDLEGLLRQKLGDQLTVKSFTAKSLLPPGENYGSTIFSVCAIIRRSKTAEEEDLRLIAKMPPPTDYQREIFDSPYTFRKEIFMYEHILPSYNRLEIELGIPPEDIFHVLPKLYGSRLSLEPTVEFDDNAAILLENLKERGYYTNKRYIGCDLEHSRLAVRAIARFHALGIAMKQKKPDYFKLLKEKSKCLEVKAENFEGALQTITKKIKEDPMVLAHYPKCKAALSLPAAIDWHIPPKEPWSTIIHADFWVNNIMFHREENGRVDDIKFVDFQNYLFFSPLRELVFYIFSSTDENVRLHHVDELINLYYETFISTLVRLKCSIEEYSRDKFDAQLPIDAQTEFGHLCFMLKVMTMNASELNFDYDKMKELMIEYDGNVAYTNRLRETIVEMMRRKWL